MLISNKPALLSYNLFKDMSRTLSIPQIARIFLQKIENRKEEFKAMSPKQRRDKRSEILGNLCKEQFQRCGIIYNQTDISELKSKVGLELSRMKKKAISKKEKPFKVTPERIREAIEICEMRHDHLLDVDDL